MPIKLGSTNFGNIYLGSTKIGEAYLGNVKVYSSTNYNPLNLPAHTIRCQFASGHTPTMGTSRTRVSAYNNIWDIYESSNDWNYLCVSDGLELLNVLGANTTGVTNMYKMFTGCENLVSVSLFDTSDVTEMRSMFDGCTSLTSVPLFDTRAATNMSYMFRYCNRLTSVPLFNTSSAINMNAMFEGCYAVERGSLALYRQASTQANPPMDHIATFKDCGKNTTTGAAELAQIPSSWGGTGS